MEKPDFKSHATHGITPSPHHEGYGSYGGVQGSKNQGIISKALQGDKKAMADYAKMTMEQKNQEK